MSGNRTKIKMKMKGQQAKKATRNKNKINLSGSGFSASDNKLQDHEPWQAPFGRFYVCQAV